MYIDTSPKKMYGQQINKQKDAQLNWSLGECKLKTTVRHNCTSMKTTKTKKADHTKCQQTCRANELSHTAGGNARCHSGNAILEIVHLFLRGLNIQLLHDPAVLLLGVYPGEIKAYVQRLTQKYHSNFLLGAPKRDSTQTSVNR